MKDIAKIIGIVLIVAIVGIGLSYTFGWVGVHQTTTYKKAQQNADREVFEETNSFVKAKRQECIKLYKEYLEADTEEDRKAIETIVSMSLADFDEDRHITDAKLLSWIKRMKY